MVSPGMSPRPRRPSFGQWTPNSGSGRRPSIGGYTLIPQAPLSEERTEEAAEEAVLGQWAGDEPQAAWIPSMGRRSHRLQTADIEPRKDLTMRERVVVHLHSIPFQVSMAAIICSNAVVVGLETDCPDMFDWKFIEDTFLVVFTLELVVRVMALGLTYFDVKEEEFVWNMFDLLIVVTGCLSFFSALTSGDEPGGGSATIFRVVRLMRVLRVLRIVRFLRQLYTLAFGFILAAIAIGWVSVLMVFVLYTCSVILVKNVQGMAASDADGYIFLVTKFGSIPRSMLSLFELMVNPYLDPYHDVIKEDAVLCAFVVGFVIFGSFGMIALLTGVIQEAMFEKNQLKNEEEHIFHDKMRVKLLRQSCMLFDEVQTNENGEAPVKSLAKLLPRISTIFRQNGLPFAFKDELEDVAEAMDLDASGAISRQEFSKFLELMAEGVRPLLLMEVRNDIVRYLNHRLDKVESLLGTARQEASAGDASPKSLRDVREVLSAWGTRTREDQQAQFDGLIRSLHEEAARSEARCAAACADASRLAVLESLQGSASAGSGEPPVATAGVAHILPPSPLGGRTLTAEGEPPATKQPSARDSTLDGVPSSARSRASRRWDPERWTNEFSLGGAAAHAPQAKALASRNPGAAPALSASTPQGSEAALGVQPGGGAATARLARVATFGHGAT